MRLVKWRRARLPVVMALALLGNSLVVIGLTLAVPVAPTTSPLPGSNFQGGDGDQTNSALDPSILDWESIAASPTLLAVGDPNASDTSFGLGSREDDPEHWDTVLVSGGATPGRANIFDTWAHFDRRSGGTFLYLALDRQEAGWPVFWAFELNQDPREWLNASKDLIQCRTTGDLIISAEIQEDDNVDVIIQQWVAETVVTAAEEAAGYTNGLGCSKAGHFLEFDPTTAEVQAAINSGRTITNFLPRSPSAASFGEELFLEVAVNLTAIGTIVNDDVCFAFQRLWLHGRSSTSSAASIQDFTGPVPLLVNDCTIGGTKYDDLDADGAIDPNDPPLSNWRLFLDSNGNDVLDPGEPIAVTDANGRYLFEALGAGTYTVREAPDSAQAAGRQGYTCTFPSSSSADCEYTVVLNAASSSASGNDFANAATPVPEPARVTVVKDAVPDSPDAFAFSGSFGAFSLDDDADPGLPNTTAFEVTEFGSKTLTEASATGWTLASIDCTNVDEEIVGSTATFSVGSGDDITCTFTNQVATIELTLLKDLLPDTDPGRFDLLIGATVLVDDGGDGASESITLAAGTHTISEVAANTAMALYETAITCREGTTVVATGAGATLEVSLSAADVTCTFTNARDFKPGSIGFWRNWRHRYDTAAFDALLGYVQTHNPSVYGQSGNQLDVARADAILRSGKKTPAQGLLGHLTALKLNLAATALALPAGDRLCTGGIVSVADIPGASPLFGSSTPTIAQVVQVVEGGWSGTLTTNKAGWQFSFVAEQAKTAGAVIESINNGSAVLMTGCS